MKQNVFFYFGAVYFFIGFLSPMFFFSTYILLGIYGILFLLSLIFTIKYRSINPAFLLIFSVFTILYTWFSWTDRTYIYRTDGVHALVGIILIGYGFLFFNKFQDNS
jgi:hypothetical protein